MNDDREKNRRNSAMLKLRTMNFFIILTWLFASLKLLKSDVKTIVYSEIALINNLTESTFGIALLLLFIPTSHDIILESAVIASQLNIILGVFLIREKAFPPKNTLIFLASLTLFSITILSLISSISKPTFELALVATGTSSCIIALTMMFAEQGVILITHSVKTKMSTVEF